MLISHVSLIRHMDRLSSPPYISEHRHKAGKVTNYKIVHYTCIAYSLARWDVRGDLSLTPQRWWK